MLPGSGSVGYRGVLNGRTVDGCLDRDTICRGRAIGLLSYKYLPLKWLSKNLFIRCRVDHPQMRPGVPKNGTQAPSADGHDEYSEGDERRRYDAPAPIGFLQSAGADKGADDDADLSRRGDVADRREGEGGEDQYIGEG
jgi:hypothetical protein